MRSLGFLIVLVVLTPFTGRAQDYSSATNAAWCAGALGAYAQRSLQSGATYLDSAQSKKLAFAQKFFGRSGDTGAEMLIFENRGSLASAECNRACAAQQNFDARAACFNASPECKRILACLTE
jgi:hypothetical protein